MKSSSKVVLFDKPPKIGTPVYTQVGDWPRTEGVVKGRPVVRSNGVFVPVKVGDVVKNYRLRYISQR